MFSCPSAVLFGPTSAILLCQQHLLCLAVSWFCRRATREMLMSKASSARHVFLPSCRLLLLLESCSLKIQPYLSIFLFFTMTDFVRCRKFTIRLRLSASRIVRSSFTRSTPSPLQMAASSSRSSVKCQTRVRTGGSLCRPSSLPSSPTATSSSTISSAS